jgi:hypothetical protein
MALRVAAQLPRLAIVGVVVALAAATLTYGAAQRLSATARTGSTRAAAPTLTVPDVTGQAFVFAKGTLEDTGFAWRVVGGVHGYAANKVATQSPVAGTKVRDTGAPTITVTLMRTAYPEKGEPEDLSPYLGTALEPIALPKPEADMTPAPATPKAADKKTAALKKVAVKVAAPASRPPAFVLPNAPKEPLKEMPLTQRARLLSAWIAAHPKPTSARVRHFLFQHAWIVTGASFGWWHGAEALRELIAADRLAQRRWGIGKKSELVARRALAEVEARTK